jgi:hypothetical protein
VVSFSVSAAVHLDRKINPYTDSAGTAKIESRGTTSLTCTLGAPHSRSKVEKTAGSFSSSAQPFQLVAAILRQLQTVAGWKRGENVVWQKYRTYSALLTPVSSNARDYTFETASLLFVTSNALEKHGRVTMFHRSC